MKHALAAIALFAIAGFSPAGPAHATSHAAHAAADSAAALADGEIRKVDQASKKLTIRHGPLENLDMPSMTMVFQVKDASMLDGVKPGDKVKFTADRIGGAYTVTHLEPAK